MSFFCLSVRLSATLCIVAKRYALQQVSEHVNRKCPPRNTILQPSTHAPTLPPQTPHLKNFKMYTFGVAIVSMAIPDNGLQLDRTKNNAYVT